MHGFISHFDEATGLGWIETNNPEPIFFAVKPGTKLAVNQRVRFNLAQRAVQIEEDTTTIENRIG